MERDKSKDENANTVKRNSCEADEVMEDTDVQENKRGTPSQERRKESCTNGR